MSKKMKIKFKNGKAKIKLKGDDALPVQGEDMRQLLGSVLQRAVPLPDELAGELTGELAGAALAQPESPVRLLAAADEAKEPGSVAAVDDPRRGQRTPD